MLHGRLGVRSEARARNGLNGMPRRWAGPPPIITHRAEGTGHNHPLHSASQVSRRILPRSREHCRRNFLLVRCRRPPSVRKTLAAQCEWFRHLRTAPAQRHGSPIHTVGLDRRPTRPSYTCYPALRAGSTRQELLSSARKSAAPGWRPDGPVAALDQNHPRLPVSNAVGNPVADHEAADARRFWQC